MKTQLLKTIEDSKLYTLSVADVLSEKKYDSVLAEGTWTFGELMNHIAYGIQWWENNYVNGKKTDWAPPVALLAKKQILKQLSDAFDSLTNSVTGAPANDQLTTGVWATLDHVTHHRGQAVVHLRKNGVTPPEYVGIGS